MLKAQSGIPARAPRQTLNGPQPGTKQRRGVNSDGPAILPHFHDARMAGHGPGNFDEIDHDALLCQIERRVCDRRMLKLLRGWLRAGVFEGGIVSAIEAGTPQGSPISPLLANIALHALDQVWQGGGQRLGVLVRYADDLVVLCATREQAEQARELVAAVLDGLGLRLHPEKTRIAHLARGAEGFTFLGFEHRMRESWRQPGRWYLQKWPSRRAMASIRGKIRDRTDRRYARLPLEWAVEDLDRVLRGWGNYPAPHGSCHVGIDPRAEPVSRGVRPVSSVKKRTGAAEERGGVWVRAPAQGSQR